MRVRWDRVAVLVGTLALAVLIGVNALVAGTSPDSSARAAAHATVSARTAPTCPAVRRDGVVRSAPLPGGAPTRGPDDGGPRTVALTFDDGPGQWTPQVLDILRRERVTATFFVVGTQAEYHPELVRRAVAEGHLVGDHTWTHTPPTGGAAWSSAMLGAELDRTQALLRGLTGGEVCWFRPPAGVLAGAFGPASQRRLTVALWSVDSQDWRVQDHVGGDPGIRPAPQIVARATAGGDQRHPVVLLHDGGRYRAADVEALPAIIAYYRAHGYTFVRLDGR